jgi:hypothetical protein
VRTAFFIGMQERVSVGERERHRNDDRRHCARDGHRMKRRSPDGIVGKIAAKVRQPDKAAIGIDEAFADHERERHQQKHGEQCGHQQQRKLRDPVMPMRDLPHVGVRFVAVAAFDQYGAHCRRSFAAVNTHTFSR